MRYTPGNLPNWDTQYADAPSSVENTSLPSIRSNTSLDSGIGYFDREPLSTVLLPNKDNSAPPRGLRRPDDTVPTHLVDLSPNLCLCVCNARWGSGGRSRFWISILSAASTSPVSRCSDTTSTTSSRSAKVLEM